jgi:DNA-binding NarL/FixJ family response regulator
MTASLRVVVVDDDARIRADFRSILELEVGIEVVGVASDGVMGVELCERLQPDVVVMDVRMPEMNGIDATARLRRHNPTTCRVLVVTTFDLDEYVLGAARAGASGFLLKDQAPDDLAEAVRTAARGEAMVSPRATARLLAEFVPRASVKSAAVAALTEREQQVVQWMAQGLSNDEIAAAAFVSLGTVKTHVSNVLTKLALSSRLQVVVWAYENGLAGSLKSHP